MKLISSESQEKKENKFSKEKNQSPKKITNENDFGDRNTKNKRKKWIAVPKVNTVPSKASGDTNKIIPNNSVQKITEISNFSDIETVFEVCNEATIVEKLRNIIHQRVFYYLWKLEFKKLIHIDPFEESFVFNVKKLIIDKVQISNCEYFQFDQVFSLITSIENYLKNKNKKFLAIIEELQVKPTPEYIEHLTGKYSMRDFNKSEYSLYNDKAEFIKRISHINLCNNFENIQEQKATMDKLLAMLYSGEKSIFWGNVSYCFEQRIITIDICDPNVKENKVFQFLKALCSIFGMKKKPIYVNQGIIFVFSFM